MQNINDRARLAAGLDYAVRLGTVAPTTTQAVEISFRVLCSNIWDWLSYRSNILFLAREVASNLDPWTGRATIVIDNKAAELNDAQLESHLNEFEDNLRIFVGIVKILRKTPVLMTQPLGVDSEGEERFNAVIRKVAAAEGTRLIDLQHGLGPHPKWAFLHDNIHFNNVGSEAVGAIIACQLDRTVIQTAKEIDVDVLFSIKNPALFTLEDCSIKN